MNEKTDIMSRKSAFVKVSGDIWQDNSFIDWVKKLSEDHFVVICVGGGTQINEAFKASGIALTTHGPLGRELDCIEHKQIARDVLELNRDKLQDILAAKNVRASVIIPVLKIGTVICHVNGDTYIRTAYLGFEHLFVVTTQDRVESKKAQYLDLPKIEVVGIEVEN
jgi:hypothetical protein